MDTLRTEAEHAEKEETKWRIPGICWAVKQVGTPKGDGPVDCDGRWSFWSNCNDVNNSPYLMMGEKTRSFDVTREPKNGGTHVLLLPKERIVLCYKLVKQDSYCGRPVSNRSVMYSIVQILSVNRTPVIDVRLSTGADGSTCYGCDEIGAEFTSLKGTNVYSISNKQAQKKDCEVQWGPWSACDVDTATQTRRMDKILSLPSGGGNPCVDMETKTCTVNLDCDGEWSEWSVCDKTTRTQTDRRSRSADSLKATAKACPSEKTRDCAVDCEYEMTKWGSCDISKGIQTRTYKVLREPMNGGEACEDRIARTNLPLTRRCDVNCQGKWSEWSACDNTSSTQRRTFSIQVPQSLNGTKCEAKDGAIETKKCKVNCEGEWKYHGEDGTVGDDSCHANGNKMKYFYRTRAAKNGGDTCSEVDDLTENFGEKQGYIGIVGVKKEPCGINCEGFWRNYGGCDESGNQTRTYEITTEPKNGGKACPSPEVRACSAMNVQDLVVLKSPWLLKKEVKFQECEGTCWNDAACGENLVCYNGELGDSGVPGCRAKKSSRFRQILC